MKTSRVILLVLAALAGGLAVGGALYANAMRPQLELGVGYGARVACACRYIGNRSLESCYTDFEPGMEVITLTDDPATKTVTASVPLLASRSVTFDPVLGCQPEAYAGKVREVR